MLRRLLPPRLARLGCQPLALRPLLALRTLAAKAGKKAERKAGKKAAQALKFTRVLQEEEALAFRSGKVLPHEHDATCALVERAVSSHRAASGRPLIALDGTRRSVARQLWDAPVACVVVGVAAGGGAAGGASGGAEEATLLAAEPTYLYANLLACEAHGAASFTELIGAPSRLPSALPGGKGGKAFESGYRKKLAHGTTLLDVTRWAVPEDVPEDVPVDAAPAPAVAYTFTRWLLEDGAVHGPRGFRLAPPLSADARGGVEAAVDAAVMQIKRLKGDEGRGNKDEAVVAAVAEMKRCREQLALDDQTIAARGQVGI